MTDRFIEIGKIVSTQGLKGEVWVYPNTDFPERFLEPGQRWLLRPGSKEPQPIKLLRGRYLDGKGLYVVQLEGFNTITEIADSITTLGTCKWANRMFNTVSATGWAQQNLKQISQGITAFHLNRQMG